MENGKLKGQQRRSFQMCYERDIDLQSVIKKKRKRNVL